ncbi:MAG: hypothetical protein ACXIVQ_10565 [Acidimicrobiales bacterium]
MGIFSKRKNRNEATLDLREAAVLDLTTADAPATDKPRVRWGFPSRCPECGDFGYLDRIDVVHELMFQHCPTCWAKWETPRSDTVDV